jgi:polysaccharide deacetylase family protein (PEP-CTERM system associated)
MKCIFTIDVEDWFHILDLPSTPKVSEWKSLESHVEKNFNRLLEIFDTHNVQATCFFLGWIAEQFPHLVKEAQNKGHEIASQGYAHELVYSLTEEEFFEDAKKSKDILENITGSKVTGSKVTGSKVTGSKVTGYRSSGFSVTENTPWFFDKLLEARYLYDSSVFPAKRGHGGLQSSNKGPHTVERELGKLLEFPITVENVFGKPLCFFGGGYLRIFPYPIIKKMAKKVLQNERPVVFYIHPREIDTQHPRLPMNFKRKFKSYVNLRTTEKKIHSILEDFEFTTFEHYFRDKSAEFGLI